MMGFRDRFDRRKRKPSTRNQRIGFALFWLLVLAYAYVIPSAPSFNTESHLYVTFSIVDRHSLNIDPYHVRLGDESYWHGHYYSDKAPGLSLLAVPVYGVLRLFFPKLHPQGYIPSGKHSYAIPRNTVYLRYAITYILVILPAAIFGVLLWLFLSRFTASGWALLLTFAYALGTTAFPYAMWFFSHQICAMLLFGTFLLLFSRVRDRAPDRKTFLLTGLAGVMAGYAVICEYPVALIAVLLTLYVVAVARGRIAAGAAFLAGMIPPAAVGLTYNILAFGKPLATGYMYVHSSLYRNTIHGGLFGLGNPLSYGVRLPAWSSLWGITFGQYRGLFLLCPVLLLFFGSLSFMWRRRDMRPEFWLCLAVVLLYFLMDASRGQDVNGWSGGSSIASRHLVPILPFMVLPMAFALESPAFRSAFLVLAGYSIAMMTAIAAVGLSTGFSIAIANPLLNQLWPYLSHGKTDTNWGMMLGLQGPETLVPWAIAAVALVARLLWLYHRLPEAAAGTGAAALELEAS